MLGIIGAMSVEVEKLKDKMENVKIINIGTMEFAQGTLFGEEAVVAVSGIGKVNAALCAHTMIIVFHADLILNVGIAGGLAPQLKVCDIVVGEAVAEHDMDTSVFGDPKGYISGIDVVYMQSSICDELYECVKSIEGARVIKGIIASGDQFICESEKKSFIRNTFHAAAADMESAAIGHACYVNNVPFGIMRVISDNADEEANMSYEEFKVTAAEYSIQVISEFLKRRGSK